MDTKPKALCQKCSWKMVDVIEAYTICVFIFVSLSSLCSQVLFKDHPCHHWNIIDDVILSSVENYYIVFFCISKDW